ncbi:hypothetical protein [Dyella mobilis]|uniref:Uncharacterized protein n=1 Tax=Dyella mobilis TaxID=1849582 RepID=A0ABS2KKB7_9GAMM|nr:hypothetical protein [Dyella mobilis]MBM7131591.1 hypothetical protein [Dyella mobilis]GLQ96434.1 hypothetical protein GCM10007863_08520 [Dyella mobilis]
MTIELLAEITGRDKQWSELAAPVFPDETQMRMRAQSILSGGEIGQCPPLTLDQARDVIAWYQPLSH